MSSANGEFGGHPEPTLKRREYAGTVAYLGLGGVWSLPSKWVGSWDDMRSYNERHLSRPIHYDRARTTYHSYARNQLARTMRGDWLLMLDCDHEFDPDLVARMLLAFERNNFDVLTGLYQYKTPPYQPTVYFWADEGVGVKPVGRWTEEYPIIQVDAAGAGCLMVRRRVFQRIARELGEQPFDIKAPYSEDLSFFQRLQQLGVRTFCDTRVRYWHMDTRKIDLHDFQIDACQLSAPKEIEAYA